MHSPTSLLQFHDSNWIDWLKTLERTSVIKLQVFLNSTPFSSSVQNKCITMSFGCVIKRRKSTRLPHDNDFSRVYPRPCTDWVQVRTRCNSLTWDESLTGHH